MSDPIQVTDADFEAKVEKSAIPVLVDFGAEWCGPCKMIAPLVEELAKELDGKFILAKVDVDAAPALAEKFGIQSIPTLLIMKEGKPVKTMVGFCPKPEIKKALAAAGVA
jgi:thioredoxin 1